MELKQQWEKSDSITIRKAQIDTLILNIDDVIDVSNTTLNEVTSNIELSKFKIPKLKEVVFA